MSLRQLPLRAVRALLCGLCVAATAGLAHGETLEEILALAEAPAGVVVEIVESDEAAWSTLLPAIQSATRQIRTRFPDLPIAVVSHGQEQFALTRQALASDAGLHTGLEQLVGEEVDLHVCGTHAGWFGVSAEDYPAFVDVAASGPAQINDYKALGFIELEQ